MKKTFTLLLLALFTLGLSAQDWLPLPETFELPYSDTVWHQFGNVDDLAENMMRVDNDNWDDTNDSEFCMQFIVQETAQTWAGAWSDAYGPMTITEDNYMLEMMVYKDVLTSCALKLENGDTDNIELYVANTVVDEWEKLFFDFSAAIGYTFNRFVFFPDFPDTRESGSMCYIDDVGFAAPVSVKTQLLSGVSIYPNPVAERITIRYPEMQGAVISNVLGQTVKSVSFQNSNLEHVELTDLKPGLYFITVDSKSGLASSKFVKE